MVGYWGCSLLMFSFVRKPTVEIRMREQGLLLLIIILSSYETGLSSTCKDIQATGYKFGIEGMEVGKEED